MNLNTDRITHPLRLAKGSHEPGSGKGCAMNVISYINGDTNITDYPECSARPLATLVQICNDQLADADDLLSPENSLLVLDLGWQTVGTAGVSDSVIHAWMAEVLSNPEWGVIRFAKGNGISAIVNIANVHRKVARGEMLAAAESAARCAAWSAGRSGRSAAVVDFTQHAITCWRDLAGLNDPGTIPISGVDSAFARISE